MRKILVLPHYFYPDVASTAQILTELCEKLQNDFEITVICVVPSYNGKVSDEYKKKRLYFKKYKNIKVIRVRVSEFSKENKISRIKNILSYFFNCIFAIIASGKQDIVFSISQPPIVGGVLGVIGKILKRSKFVYNIQDLNPEQTEAIGYVKNKMIVKLSKIIDKSSCKMADEVVVVGRDMKDKLSERFKDNSSLPSIEVINNWINSKEIFPLSLRDSNVLRFKRRYELNDKFVFMYSGNIGLYYDLENIIKTIGQLKKLDDAVFVFVGDGATKSKLMDYCRVNELYNVVFVPYQDKEGLVYSLNAADAQIVTSAKGIKGISVPSKIYGILASGKFVIGVLEKGSEARRIIEECNCGRCIEPEDYEGLKKLLIKTYERRNEIKKFGLRGKRYLDSNLDMGKCIEKYKMLFLKLLDNSLKEEHKGEENYG